MAKKKEDVLDEIQIKLEALSERISKEERKMARRLRETKKQDGKLDKESEALLQELEAHERERKRKKKE